MYLVFTRMPGESYRRRLRSFLWYLYYVFRARIVLILMEFVSVDWKFPRRTAKRNKCCSCPRVMEKELCVVLL